MKALLISTVASMIEQFNMSNIQLLFDEGYEVNVACNFAEGNTCDENSIKSLQKKLTEMNVRWFHIDFPRKIHAKRIVYVGMQLRKLLRQNDYSLIHCQAPVAATMTRLLLRRKRRNRTKIIYTAHGFYFYKGSPIKNWMIFYPIEWLCAWRTDMLITTNQEDYQLAKKHMHAKQVLYIPGVGIDLKKYHSDAGVREEKRRELNLAPTDLVLLSAGELSPRKNHQVVLEAIERLKGTQHYQHIKCLLCGIGPLEAELKKKADKAGISDHVKFLGYRTDLSAICACSDLFVFMSLYEGLSVALMGAMACGLPIICSNARGNTDLIQDDISGRVIQADRDVLATVIDELLADKDLRLRYADAAQEYVKKFDITHVNTLMRDIYKSVGWSTVG